MILIADGGSTKADWIALDSNKKEHFRVRTLGLNPDRKSVVQGKSVDIGVRGITKEKKNQLQKDLQHHSHKS